MFYIGVDVSEKNSFVHVVDGRGNKVESREIPTDKDGYRQYFKKWIKKSVEVAIEAGGHSRWIHDTLKALGISVYIVNPNKVKLIAKSKKKTDSRCYIPCEALTDRRVTRESVYGRGRQQRVA
jgi:transposase